MEVAITRKALDLFSQKFGLDRLGQPGERIILRVSLSVGERPLSMFGTYTIGSRHAQISAAILSGVNDSQVSEVIRYDVGDAVRDINQILRRDFERWNLELAMKEGVFQMKLESRVFPASIKRVYTVGGRIYVVVQILGKLLRIEFFGSGVRMFDTSRRELGGLTVAGNRLILRRKFQHPELSIPA